MGRKRRDGLIDRVEGRGGIWLREKNGCVCVFV